MVVSINLSFLVFTCAKVGHITEAIIAYVDENVSLTCDVKETNGTKIEWVNTFHPGRNTSRIQVTTNVTELTHNISYVRMTIF